jgi:hypothetical protein
MLYPDEATSKIKNAGLYFMMNSISEFLAVLKEKSEIIEITEKTAYGRKEIVFKDINNFQVTFSCEPD